MSISPRLIELSDGGTNLDSEGMTNTSGNEDPEAIESSITFAVGTTKLADANLSLSSFSNVARLCSISIQARGILRFNVALTIRVGHSSFDGPFPVARDFSNLAFKFVNEVEEHCLSRDFRCLDRCQIDS